MTSLLDNEEGLLRVDLPIEDGSFDKHLSIFVSKWIQNSSTKKKSSVI
jgi:hypothetical protein